MQTALITGASGNLGQAVVKKFLAEGFYVVGTVIPYDPIKLEITHPEFETSTANLMEESGAEKLVQGVIEKKGQVDVAVLTVGGFAMGGIAETRSADLLKQYKLNFETAYHVARPVFLQMMKQGNGRIFLIGARPGISMKSSKGMTAYGFAKSLIFRLAELLNEEAKGTHVVCSVIVPSTIDTPQNRKSMPDADFSTWVRPEEIADAIYFYSSPAGAAIREPVIKLFGNS